MAPDRTERKLTAILSADVVGYSRLMADDEAATVEALKATWELLDGLIRQHGGRVVDAVGDNLLADFPSVVDAVACGVLVQQELGSRNAELAERRRMLLRIGPASPGSARDARGSSRRGAQRTWPPARAMSSAHRTPDAEPALT